MGFLRLLLALAVVVNHLSWELGKFSGPIAVFGFYTVSGYLIVGAISKSYVNRPVAFLVNRALRIYPSYWFLAAVGAAVAMFGTPLNPAIALPSTADGWLRQISILGLLNPDGTQFGVRLVPPAWSVSIELFWYGAMVVLWRYTAVWLGIAAVLSLAFAWFGWEAVYYSYLAPGVCFALGGFCQQRGFRIERHHLAIASALLLGLFVVGNYLPPSTWLMYAASGATAYILVSLPKSREEGIAKLAGELAYPVFLCHWAVASLSGQGKGPISLLINVPLILAFSLLIVFLIERPIASLRSRVRNDSISSQTAEALG